MPLKISEDEDATERDGFLSTYAEWHALVIGFGMGLTGVWLLIVAFLCYSVGKNRGRLFDETAQLKDAAKEPAYAIGGLILGLLVHMTFIIPVVMVVLPV